MKAHQADVIERGWWTFRWVGVIAAYVGIVSFFVYTFSDAVRQIT